MKVTVQGITKRYTVKGTPAVFDTSFAAEAGGITTLLGPSGSGKTTLLRIIAGLERPDTGQILFGERDVTRLAVRERGLGFVFQSFALFSHMTVRRNIGFALEVSGLAASVREARVDELLALVQLDGLGDRFPKQLSGGQRQRVGFARALASRPSILLLDEPFAALDARVRVELRDWLIHLHETTKLTSILVTHDQQEALELSQRIVVMDRGKVVQVGTPAEIYDHPQTPFVASFVGTANILDGRVTGERAAIGSLSVSVPAGLPDGAAVRAVVRPHDVRLARDVGNQSRSVGTVTRLAGLGSYVKLQLRLPSDDSVTVEMPRAEADSLRLVVGDRVIVDLAEAKVFVGDYSI